MRQIPPLAAVRVFEAAAKIGVLAGSTLAAVVGMGMLLWVLPSRSEMATQ